MPTAAPKSVTVSISAGRFTSLDQVNKIVASTLGKLGHPGCFSGFDIRFDHTINELHFQLKPKTFEVEQLAHG